MIVNISRNSALTATEIRTIQDENRRLCRQLARAVLLNTIEEDGAIFPGGAKGNIRKVVEIMDGTISEVLQPGGATVDLELWQVHAEHTKKVSNDGGKR